MKEKPNYYAVIPSEVRYADITPNAKLLYAEITALTSMNGKCNASTNYFAELYKVSKTSIQNWLKCLEDNKFITRKNIYKEGSKEILSRYIKLFEYPTQNKLRDNNNITYSNNNITYSKGRFKKPTINDIKKYCLERKNQVDAETFFDFYESKNWKVGKNKMKDWKACVRTWEKRNYKTNNNTTSHRHQAGQDYGDGKF
tara:strand:+ start:8653 stop:9249 length:597 start_codon:yes stop_codon:yes gene_type:complete